MTIEIHHAPAPIMRVLVSDGRPRNRVCAIYPEGNDSIVLSRTGCSAPVARLTADEAEQLANALLSMVETIRTALR